MRSLPLVSLLLLAGCQPAFDEIASGHDINPAVRPAIAQDGTVLAAEATRLLVGDGTTLTAVDLAPFALTINTLGTATPTMAVQIRDAGDLVFVGERAGVMGCAASMRGAYRLDTSGAALGILRETCLFPPVTEKVIAKIAMSPNGTVAFSSVLNGGGAIWRGPASGPVAALHAGSGEFYNSGALDVNDAGRTMVQMEYFDGFAGGLMRGVLAFDTPEQPKLDLDTALEKLGIGTQPDVAINAGGTVAFALSGTFSMTIGGMVYMCAGGVYRAIPTPFNSPKSLTAVADLSGPYCRFGRVDINAAGTVAFEAALDSGTACASGPFDGIFTGPDPSTATVVARGMTGLGAHQYFDDVVLGQINDAGQVAFLTTYSEPLVDSVKVWRR
jgi:hypothetical protein